MPRAKRIERDGPVSRETRGTLPEGHAQWVPDRRANAPGQKCGGSASTPYCAGCRGEATGLTRRTTVRVPVAHTPHPPNDLGLGVTYRPEEPAPLSVCAEARRTPQTAVRIPRGRFRAPVELYRARGDELTARGLVRNGARLSASRPRRASEGRVSPNQEPSDSSTIARRRDAPGGGHRDDRLPPQHADADRPSQPIAHPSSSRESHSSQRMSYVASRRSVFARATRGGL